MSVLRFENHNVYKTPLRAGGFEGLLKEEEECESEAV